VSADDTSAASGWNGNFGKSPFYGQLSGKLLLATKIQAMLIGIKPQGASKY
jgi:hypothetical protein